jgi:hypothetical protein
MRSMALRRGVAKAVILSGAKDLARSLRRDPSLRSG